MANKKPVGNEFLDTQQAADFLGISIDRLRRLLRQGKVPYVEFGPRTRRIPVAALVELARRRLAE